ncbi:MAG TPA: aromatic ring-hydroxylating dioxygenase subunit alpha [Steroidobacteraceae bacterium]|nr:aromatic ring-hydroxylating dioxygenase subunit alpha [Steroidobacteraceae bacterium]
MNATTAQQLAERRQLAARAIRRRLVGHVAAGGATDLADAPLEQEAASYLDAAIAAREVAEIFLKRPLIAGLSQDLPAPGDRIVFDALGRSVIVVRQHSGELRAYRNMCLHRAAKLVRPDAQGRCPSARLITCPFHAWTYDLDGKLRAVPGPEGFAGLDLASRRLLPVAVAECNGIVFVRLEGGEAPIDCAATLGGFAPVLELLELAEFAPVQASQLDARTNWKYAIDTYAEGYHFGVLHASTIGGTHFSNVAAFDAFGPHWRLNFAERSLAALAGRPESLWPEPQYEGIHFVFPNTVLVAGAPAPGEAFVRMFRIFPGATPGEMTCRFSVYVRGVSAAAFRARFGGIDDSGSDVTLEDYRVAVEAFANLASAPAGFRVVFGRNEPAVQAFHRAVAAAIGATF